MLKKAILTVEDSKALRFVIKTIFSKDYSVTSVPSCNAAVQKLHAHTNKHDLIILDIPDTDSDNFKLLEHIATSSYLSNIPTVVLSNSGDENLKSEAIQLGASFFIKKPFDPVFLADKVRELTHGDTKELAPKRRNFINLNIF